jgi:hypothetical protein
MQFKWTFDSVRQELHSPGGTTLTVRVIAQWVQDRIVNRIDLTGPWAGWRLRGQYLKGPNGQCITAQNLRWMMANSCTENSTPLKSEHTREQLAQTSEVEPLPREEHCVEHT